MSGIFGIVRFDGKIVEREGVEKMLAAVQNHGNDGEGIWVDGNVGFGHTMLWTTPESLHETQPHISQNGSHILVSDARVDNRNELIRKLEVNVNDLDIITDAELILQSYQRWGGEFVKYLMGDFSFAIWDKKEKKVFAARDRFGTRPLYFFFNNNLLYFSSYIEAFLNTKEHVFSLNDDAVRCFGKFATVKYDETMYENIFRIPPAYSLTFSSKGLRKDRYWFPEQIKINLGISLEEASSTVNKLLFDAVESRLRVYGNWGCELSGGLDSSAVALIAKEFEGKQFKTFTMRYRSYSCDEWAFADELITHLGSDPICIDVDRLDFKHTHSMNSLPELSRHWPVYGSFIPNYVLGEAMEDNGIRICLTGHGGDHVFTGADNFTLDYLRNFQWKLLVNEYSFSANSIFCFLNDALRALLPKRVKKIIKVFLSAESKSDSNQPEDVCDYWDMEAMKSDVALTNLQYIAGRHHVMHTDSNHYRSLERNERLEFRHPFLDTKLVEYVLSLPNHYKYSRGTIKIVLREALKKLYPDKIYRREDKAEFSESLLAQLKFLDIQDIWKNSTLLKNKLIDDKVLLHKLLEQYRLNSIDAAGVGKLWRLTTLELWVRNKTFVK